MADADSTGARRADSETPRARAKRLGHKHYSTGLPCRQGHTDVRFTSNGTCRACLAESTAQYRAAHPDEFKQANRRSKERNHDAQLMRRNELKLIRDPDLARRKSLASQDRAARDAARIAGADEYVSVRPCIHAHVGQRFTKSYGCVACHIEGLNPEPVEITQARMACRLLAAQRSARRAEVESARSAAIAAGATTYDGDPCPRGHPGLRWTSSYGCVECGRRAEAKLSKRRYDREYRAANPELWIERAREWRARNPERRKSICKAYDARRRQRCEGGDSTADIHAWELAAPKVCYWCGCKCASAYHLDHYQPLSKGGMHARSNLVIACPTCNLRKNAKDPFEFANQMGRLF